MPNKAQRLKRAMRTKGATEEEIKEAVKRLRGFALMDPEARKAAQALGGRQGKPRFKDPLTQFEKEIDDDNKTVS